MNFKVRCIDNPYGKNMYTVGKIYEFIDGHTIDDGGDRCPYMSRVDSFDEFCAWSSCKWELVEEEPMKFKVGDRVRALIEVGKQSLAVKGAVGTIVTIDNDNQPYGVEFDSDINGHDLQGDCIDGHGWWLRADEIELVEDEKCLQREI